MSTMECERIEDRYYEVMGEWRKVVEEYENERERGITEEGKQSLEDTILSLKNELDDLSFRLQDCKKMSQRQEIFK